MFEKSKNKFRGVLKNMSIEQHHSYVLYSASSVRDMCKTAGKARLSINLFSNTIEHRIFDATIRCIYLLFSRIITPIILIPNLNEQ